MRGWWMAFAAGWISGAITVTAMIGARRVEREQRLFNEGRLAERERLVPPRPVAEVPNWHRRHHPAYRTRGTSDVTVALCALCVAGLILLASGTFGGGL